MFTRYLETRGKFLLFFFLFCKMVNNTESKNSKNFLSFQGRAARPVAALLPPAGLKQKVKAAASSSETKLKIRLPTSADAP